MKGSYAVIWRDDSGVGSGRLEPCEDRFELSGRGRSLSIVFSGLAGASIARAPAERLRGLPVLRFLTRGGSAIAVASLEGAGVLHELAEHVERSGLRVAA